MSPRRKPYPSYKDSGVGWLGRIPEQWHVKRLKFLASQPLAYGANESAELHDPTQPRFIRITDINGDGSLHGDTFRSLPEEVARPFLLKEGDLLLARSGATVGKTFMYRQSWGRACHAGYLIRCRLNLTTANPGFISYFATSSAYWGWLSSVFIQATIQNVSAEKYGNLVVPLPPVAEQRTIASFLDRETGKIDALVKKKERLIDLLKEKRTTLISHIVTQGLNPNAHMKDSGVDWLGQIPAHWQMKRLKFIAEVRSGAAKGRDFGERDTIEVPYLRVANVQDGYLDLTDVATILIGKNELDRFSLRKGDVLMNEGGDYDKLGRGSVWQGSIDPCVHQNHVFAVRPHDLGDSNWINTVTLTSYAKFYFMAHSKQSTNLASISGTNVQELPVPMPPGDERNAILNLLDLENAKLHALVAKVREAVGRLQEYRTALISAAVTGQIDVRQ